jgi:hypothetical protein
MCPGPVPVSFTTVRASVAGPVAMQSRATRPSEAIFDRTTSLCGNGWRGSRDGYYAAGYGGFGWN